MTSACRATQVILIDIGGVLIPDYLPAVAAEWSTRLRMSTRSLLAAVFGGNDEQVLIGRMSESSWWDVVRDRLRNDPDLLAELQGDLAARESWDNALVTRLHRLRRTAKTALVSNTWPHMRTRMANAGLLDIADELVLSCEVGYAKPDIRIYRIALQRLRVDPSDALFIDDTAGHVAAAESLGMTGHVHRNTADTIARIDHFLARRA